jgi:DNA-binding CsgD family transcriptional regulator
MEAQIKFLQRIELSSLKFSHTELKVLELICFQFSSYEMADKLFLSIKTIENARCRLLEKTNSRNTAGLVIFAIRNGFFNL